MFCLHKSEGLENEKGTSHPSEDLRQIRETRKVDNLIGTTAKEIKSGQLKGSEFIDNQLRKDLMMLDFPDVPVNKIEWHLFDGADQNMLDKLNSIKEAYGADKFDFIDYTNLKK